jgi:malonyl-CoA O-methyltransferase
MFDTGRIRADFSSAATRYDVHALLQQQVLRKLVSTLSLAPQARVLDGGCGTGMLHRLLDSAEVISLDLAYAMCAQAAKYGANTVNATLHQLPFPDNSMDAVVSSLVLQWVHHWQGALAEMRRVLKPGGVMAVSTFGAGTLKELKASFAAVDGHAHISDFLPASAFLAQETVTQYVPDVQTLMRQLKAIGARNKLSQRSRSLMTPRQLARVEDYYRAQFGTAQGLPVTWEILTSISGKP